MSPWVAAIIAAVLGGGLWQGISSVYKAIVDGRSEKALTDQLGLKSPFEVEGIAVATMRAALEAAEARILAMGAEREADRKYYQDRIAELQEVQSHTQARMLSIQRELDIAVREAHEAMTELAELRQQLQPPREA